MSREKIAVVFGGRSPIALSCASYLSHQQPVVVVTRSIDKEIKALIKNSPTISLVEGDLQFPTEARRVIEQIYNRGYDINGVVFLQRYRPGSQIEFTSHVAVEIWSVKEALDTIRKLKRTTSPIQVLVGSSPAAANVLTDQNLDYHIVKSGQEALVRYYAVMLSDINVWINALRIGSVVLKERAMPYWDSIPRTVEIMKSLTPSRRLQTSDVVGHIFAKLILTNAVGITGQVISTDDGFQLRDPIQLLKTALVSDEKPDPSF